MGVMGMRVATSAQLREMDRITMEEHSVPSTLLMERAATALVREAAAMLPTGREDTMSPHAVLFCGTGNNGGDGLAAARLLQKAGWQVEAYLVGSYDKMSPDCWEMETRLDEMGGRLIPFTEQYATMERYALSADLIIDALFGIGLNTEITGLALEAVALMNRSPAPVLSADIPSGVEADTGRVLGAAVKAARTVTFTLPKVGLYVDTGALHSGDVVVADIGIPSAVVDAQEYPVQTPEQDALRLPRRRRNAHKGDFGKLYVLGGSMGYSGAPVLAAGAALRSGAGLVSVGVPRNIWGVTAGYFPEPMFHPLPDDGGGRLVFSAHQIILDKLRGSDVCLVGPGLGRSGEISALVRRMMQEAQVPLVLDADGIFALEGQINALDERRERITVLTTHEAEYATLPHASLKEGRLASARQFAQDHGCILVLKGYRAITAFPDGTAVINTTGNPGMATCGSGDVLSGMIASFLGQGIDPAQAVPLAVYAHGKTGDVCASTLGEYGIVPTDLVTQLAFVLKELTEP